MRRLMLLVVLIGALALGSAGPTFARQDDATPTHPIVGTWLVDTDPDDPGNTLETFIFTADGGYADVDSEGVTLGAWEATGASTGDLTLVAYETDDDGRAFGVFTIRASFEVSADGQSFTATYTAEFVTPDGASTGEAGPGAATGTRVLVEAPGTPVMTMDEFWGAMFAEFDGMSDDTEHDAMVFDQDIIVFDLMSASGEVVGMGAVTAMEDGGTVVTALVSGLAPGEHGIHIHETGLCDASTETPFSSAGGHFNPAGAMHGEHAGDLGNLLADADGDALLISAWSAFTLDAGDASLLDADGSALVIHETVDDLVTDPSGNSGGRIACGVIAPPM